MKKPFVVLVASMLVLDAMWAGELPLPSFTAGSIDLPPLSLVEGARTGRLFSPEPAAKPIRFLTYENFRVTKAVSKMPIVVPRGDVDKKMPIKAPDSSIDFKLLIRKPALETAKYLRRFW